MKFDLTNWKNTGLNIWLFLVVAIILVALVKFNLYVFDARVRFIVNDELNKRSSQFHVLHVGGDPHIVWRYQQTGVDPKTNKPIVDKVVWYMDLPLQNDHVQIIKQNPLYKTCAILP